MAQETEGVSTWTGRWVSCVPPALPRRPCPWQKVNPQSSCYPTEFQPFFFLYFALPVWSSALFILVFLSISCIIYLASQRIRGVVYVRRNYRLACLPPYLFLHWTFRACFTRTKRIFVYSAFPFSSGDAKKDIAIDKAFSRINNRK